MCQEVSVERELFLADYAREGFSSGVAVLMVAEIGGILKTFTANIAIINIFIQVIRVNMPQDGRLPPRLIIAKWAFKTARIVALIMDRELIQRIKFAIAYGTNVGLVCLNVVLHLLLASRLLSAIITGINAFRLVVGEIVAVDVNVSAMSFFPMFS